MKLQSAGNSIEAIKLTQTINTKKQEDARKFDVKKTNEALISGTITICSSEKMFGIRRRTGGPTTGAKY